MPRLACPGGIAGMCRVLSTEKLASARAGGSALVPLAEMKVGIDGFIGDRWRMFVV